MFGSNGTGLFSATHTALWEAQAVDTEILGLKIWFQHKLVHWQSGHTLQGSQTSAKKLEFVKRLNPSLSLPRRGQVKPQPCKFIPFLHMKPQSPSAPHQ